MKTDVKETISAYIQQFKLKEAESELKTILQQTEQDDEAYFMLGNIYRKQSNWQEALQCYAKALEINPKSPALHAREMILSIMAFYDKERYNV